MPTQTLKPKQKRKMQAYKQKYLQNKSHQEIADQMGLSYDTIASYFREEEMEEIRKLYDEEEIEFMRFQAFQEIQDVKRNGRDYISRAIQHEEADDTTFLRAEKEERELMKDWIEMMQEISVFKKPKERKEVEQKGSAKEEEFTERLQEAYQELEQEEEEVEQSAD